MLRMCVDALGCLGDIRGNAAGNSVNRLNSYVLS